MIIIFGYWGGLPQHIRKPSCRNPQVVEAERDHQILRPSLQENATRVHLSRSGHCMRMYLSRMCWCVTSVGFLKALTPFSRKALEFWLQLKEWSGDCFFSTFNYWSKYTQKLGANFFVLLPAVAYSSASSSRETTKKLVWQWLVGRLTTTNQSGFTIRWLTVNFIPLVASRVYFFAWLTFDKKSGF